MDGGCLERHRYVGVGELSGTDLKVAANRIIAEIPPSDLRELMSKSRFSYESRYMMAMVAAAGWDTANQMNSQVAEAVGKGEMHRLLALLGLDVPKNDEDLLLLISLAMELFMPKKYFDYEFTVLENGKMLGIVKECLAYTKIKSVGAQDSYQCGCFGMRAGWYKAMGIDVKERAVKCLLDGDDRCEILIEGLVYPMASYAMEAPDSR